jgi:hypothetical protein
VRAPLGGYDVVAGGVAGVDSPPVGAEWDPGGADTSVGEGSGVAMYDTLEKA